MRKGDVPMQMVMMGVLMGFFLLIIALIYIQVKDKYEDAAEKSKCEQQIRAHALLQKYTREEFISNLDCPTKIIRSPNVNEEELRELVADEMVSCWQMWGEGKYSLFEDEVGVFCHVCAAIYPDSVALSQLEKYLVTEKYNKTHTYADYFTGEILSPESKDKFSRGNFGVWQTTYERPVGVIFRYEKSRTTSEKLRNSVFGDPKIMGVIGGGGGAVLGYVVVGTVVGATSVVSIPIIIAGTVVAGGAGAISGVVWSIFEGKDISTKIPTIHALVMTDERVKNLGCQQLPA